uniref:Uncharacterized protein n=1 Tax=Aegilops tauschii subsp. strangulata TaxID=200361 RepID=A0A453EVR4_AEGTS
TDEEAPNKAWRLPVEERGSAAAGVDGKSSGSSVSACCVGTTRWSWRGRSQTTPLGWLLCFSPGTRSLGRVYLSYAYYLSRYLHATRGMFAVLRRRRGGGRPGVRARAVRGHGVLVVGVLAVVPGAGHPGLHAGPCRRLRVPVLGGQPRGVRRPKRVGASGARLPAGAAWVQPGVPRGGRVDALRRAVVGGHSGIRALVSSTALNVLALLRHCEVRAL